MSTYHRQPSCLPSQFSGNGEKYPDATAMAMDDVNKKVSRQLI